MCHRSSSALRTRFHRGNDILKVYHYQVNHYTRKKESDERKRIQRHDFSGSSRKSSMVSFSFHSFTLVFIRVHRTNEPFQFWHLESIESLPPRISVLLLKKFIHLEKKKMRWWNNQLRNRTSSKFCPLSVEAIVSSPSFWQDSNDSLKLREEGDQKLLNAE